MRSVNVTIDLDDDSYRAYEAEARRSQTTVETLVQQVLQKLYGELEREEKEGDHPILLP